MSATILIIAAHPDDELLGVAGAARKHVESGDRVHALILGQGALSRDGGSDTEVESLKSQARRAGEIIGFADVAFDDLPDNAFDTVSLLSIAKKAEAALARVRPDIVFTHHEHDLNVDHRLTFQAVLTACRPCNDLAPKALYTFETLSSTEWQSKDAKSFRPTLYVDIEGQVDRKIEALRCYVSEIRPYPHARSLEGVRILAQFRGLESGLRFAEAFQLIRHVER
jgi:N-acetylglucosamine malate deacetylase 1